MTSGTPDRRAGGLFVRNAEREDLDAIKRICDSHKEELGFVHRGGLVSSIGRKEVLCALVDGHLRGFVEYHHRRDGQTTLYHIAVDESARRKGVACELIKTLAQASRNMGKDRIVLKCPISLDANDFYEAVGFSRLGIEPGKTRQLQLWQLDL